MFWGKNLMEEKISEICNKVSLNIPFNCLLCLNVPFIIFVSKYFNLKRFYVWVIPQKSGHEGLKKSL